LNLELVGVNVAVESPKKQETFDGDI